MRVRFFRTAFLALALGFAAPWSSGCSIVEPAPEGAATIGQTIVRFTLAEDAAVRITLFESSGRKVKLVFEEQLEAGQYGVNVDGADAGGNALPSGAYVLLLEIGDEREERVLVKF